jgi:glycosyltransferase involved in cell wall biosynthesis
MKNILFFSYLFPPLGGAGIQRSYSFVKYLPQFGFNPIVVTADPASEGKLIVNNSLKEDLENIKIVNIPVTPIDLFKKRLFMKSIVKILPLCHIDARWWLTSAIQTCTQVVKNEKIDIVYITASPFLASKIGIILLKKYNLPWLLDLRDPWAIDDIKEYTTFLHYMAEKKLMKKACHSATAVIMNTPAAQKELLSTFPTLPPKKILCITNGFDDDLIKPKYSNYSKPPNSPLSIIYCGHFMTSIAIEVDTKSRQKYSIRSKKTEYKFKNIFKYRPGSPDLLCRSPFYLMNAIRNLIENKRITRTTLKITFVGNLSTHDHELIKQFGLEDIVHFKNYTSYKESIELYRKADVLLITQHKPSKGKALLSIPGKTYDLIGMGKRILALVPEGDAKNILTKSGIAVICEPDCISDIEDGILKFVTISDNESNEIFKPDWNYIEQFSRKKLTQKLSEVLSYALSSKI